ncbi:GNAT family N-acetyltransferase [bacterium]|nr:GNAT family N-acetyltransferase [bacterium]
MISINTLRSFDEIINLKSEYIKSLTGPQEAWLEEQAWNHSIYEICFNKQRIGYFCADSSCRMLLQFYVSDNHIRESQEIFPFLISNNYFKKAYVTTRDTLTLSLCLDCQKKILLEAYLFQDNKKVKMELKDFENTCFGPATESDMENINDVFGDFFGNLEEVKKRYSEPNNELFVLYSDKVLLGAGCVESKYCSLGSANIGIFVNEDFRRRQIGSYIVTKLKEYCYSNDLVPIAACYHANNASKKTLEKAGFVTKDRTIIVEF